LIPPTRLTNLTYRCSQFERHSEGGLRWQSQPLREPASGRLLWPWRSFRQRRLTETARRSPYSRARVHPHLVSSGLYHHRPSLCPSTRFPAASTLAAGRQLQIERVEHTARRLGALTYPVRWSAGIPTIIYSDTARYPARVRVATHFQDEHVSVVVAGQVRMNNFGLGGAIDRGLDRRTVA
jgi:hypothetical protein